MDGTAGSVPQPAGAVPLEPDGCCGAGRLRRPIPFRPELPGRAAVVFVVRRAGLCHTGAVPDAADLELSLRAAGGGEYVAELRFLPPGGAADTHREGRVRLAPEALPDPGLDPRAYGAALAAGLFADPRLREAVAAARGQAAAAGAPLRVRLRLAAGAEELHGLAWETLLEPGALDDPAGAGFWFAGERVLLSRYLDSPDPGGTSGAPAARCGPWSPWPPRRTPRPSASTPWTPRPRPSERGRPWAGSPRWCWAGARAAPPPAWPGSPPRCGRGRTCCTWCATGAAPRGGRCCGWSGRTALASASPGRSWPGPWRGCPGARPWWCWRRARARGAPTTPAPWPRWGRGSHRPGWGRWWRCRAP